MGKDHRTVQRETADRSMRFEFEPPGRDRIKFAWGHGRYLDAWSVVHILSGLMMGIALLGFGVPVVTGVLVALVAAIVYEGLEMAAGVIENLANVVTDIVLSTIGLLLAYWLLSGQNGYALAAAFAVIGALNLILVYLGWRNHLRALVRRRAAARSEPGGPEDPG